MCKHTAVLLFLTFFLQRTATRGARSVSLPAAHYAKVTPSLQSFLFVFMFAFTFRFVLNLLEHN